MKNAFIISLLLILIIGCSTKSRKLEEIKDLHIKDSLDLVYQQDSTQKAKLEIERQLIQDSIINKEEKIAIADIYFGITPSEYRIKEKAFLNPLLDKQSNRYQIGEFSFKLMPCFTEDNSLYYLCFKGNSFGSLQSQYESLISVLRAKYSKPDNHYGLPNWNEKDQELVWEHDRIDYFQPFDIFRSGEHYYPCDIWEIGIKESTLLEGGLELPL